MGNITGKRFKIKKRVYKTPTVFISLLIYEKIFFSINNQTPKTAPVFVIFRLAEISAMTALVPEQESAVSVSEKQKIFFEHLDNRCTQNENKNLKNVNTKKIIWILSYPILAQKTTFQKGHQAFLSKRTLVWNDNYSKYLKHFTSSIIVREKWVEIERKRFLKRKQMMVEK